MYNVVSAPLGVSKIRTGSISSYINVTSAVSRTSNSCVCKRHKGNRSRTSTQRSFFIMVRYWSFIGFDLRFPFYDCVFIEQNTTRQTRIGSIFFFFLLETGVDWAGALVQVLTRCWSSLRTVKNEPLNFGQYNQFYRNKHCVGHKAQTFQFTLESRIFFIA